MLAAANDLAPDRRAMPLVAIVDADQGARSSTRCLLESNSYRCLTFADAGAFLRASLPERPDCILLDVQPRGRDGLEVLRRLSERSDCPPILIASAHAHLDVAVAAMKLGAADFVQKPYAPAELVRALEGLAPLAVQSETADALSDELRPLVDSLPRRQRQVLAGIVRGLPNKAIAWELQLSVRTVEYYRAFLFRRLGIRSVAEAVRIGLAAKLEGC